MSIEILSKKLSYDKIKEHYEKKLKQKQDKFKEVKDGIPYKTLKYFVEYNVKLNKEHKIYDKILKYINKQKFYKKEDNKKVNFNVDIKDFNVYVSLEKCDNKLHFKRVVLELGDIELDRKQYRINIYGTKYYFTFYKSHNYSENNKVDLEPHKITEEDSKNNIKLISKLENLYSTVERELKEIGINNVSVFYEQTKDNNRDYAEEAKQKIAAFVPYKKPDYRKRIFSKKIIYSSNI